MGEVLIEYSICGMEMKYSNLKAHICPRHKIGGIEELIKLLEEIIDENNPDDGLKSMNWNNIVPYCF